MPLAAADFAERDVSPSGGSGLYASPELLCSLLLKIEGRCSDDQLMISRPPCDIWSAAVMFYEYLTGKLPFLPEADADLVEAPSHVKDKHKVVWRHYKSTLDAQQSWVGSVALKLCFIANCIKLCKLPGIVAAVSQLAVLALQLLEISAYGFVVYKVHDLQSVLMCCWCVDAGECMCVCMGSWN